MLTCQVGVAQPADSNPSEQSPEVLIPDIGLMLHAFRDLARTSPRDGTAGDILGFGGSLLMKPIPPVSAAIGLDSAVWADRDTLKARREYMPFALVRGYFWPSDTIQPVVLLGFNFSFLEDKDKYGMFAGSIGGGFEVLLTRHLSFENSLLLSGRALISSPDPEEQETAPNPPRFTLTYSLGLTFYLYRQDS